MKRSKATVRKLTAESLEGRQLLHGGSMSGGEPPTTAERVEGVFDRFDANEDAVLTADEVSERLWSKLSEADADESSSVSSEELTAYIDNLAAENDGEGGEEQDRRRRGERDRNNDRGRDRERGASEGERERTSLEERIASLFARYDENEDSLLTQDEVSERLWARIAEADQGEDGVSSDELAAHIEAQRQARFEAAFNRQDENGDGSITADEVSEARWERLSAADADGDGGVTAQEIQDYRAEQKAARDEAAEDEAAEDEAGEESTPEDTNVQ